MDSDLVPEDDLNGERTVAEVWLPGGQKLTLAELLLARVTQGNLHGEIDMGPPLGK